jgi:hypothetical protein
MSGIFDYAAMAAMLALSACAFVGLDIAMRPGHYQAAGRPAALQSLSRRLLPRLTTASAFRLIGLAMAALTLGSALLIFAYEFSYYSTR